MTVSFGPSPGTQKAVAAPESGGYFSDWRVQLPIGFLAAIPLVHNQVYYRRFKLQAFVRSMRLL